MKKAGIFLGIILPLALLFLTDFGDQPQTSRMAAIALMMSIFWVTEAIPLAATALIPLSLFPLLGIASSKATASQYMNSTVFLLIGGFMIALAMQKWNLHKRIALNILASFGGKPIQIVIGFMLATAGLSMWISNTATTLMMLPIALAIISRYENFLSPQQSHRFTVGLLLSIAYSASIGGMMTLVGTAPNLVFSRFYQTVNDDSVGFLQWMLLALPIGISLLIIVLVLISICYFRNLPHISDLKQLVVDEKNQLGKISYEEKLVLFIFSLTAMLWVTRKGLTLGSWVVQGWSNLLPYGKMIDDGSVAICMATVLFFIPTKNKQTQCKTLLDHHLFTELPWSIVLLFGGGFALAFGFSESGLSTYLASQLQGLKNASLPLMIVTIAAAMNLLTELTSNTATTQLVMPILLSTAKVMDIHPVWLMLPAVLSASCAFMFPVATPPNAIIFGSNKIKVFEMVRIGVALNLVAIIIISIACYYWVSPVYLAS